MYLCTLEETNLKHLCCTKCYKVPRCIVTENSFKGAIYLVSACNSNYGAMNFKVVALIFSCLMYSRCIVGQSFTQHICTLHLRDDPQKKN